MGVIDEVKQRTDIIEVISQYAKLTKAGRTFKALCPFHSEKHPSFYVYPEQQSWHCFGACSTGGDVFSFIMKKEGIDFGDALRLLAGKVGVVLSTKPEPKEDEKERLYQANEAAARYYHNLLLNSPAGERAKNYLSGRGILPDTITVFQLGFSPNSRDDMKRFMLESGYAENELTAAGLIIEAETGGTHDRFRNRLMFPIFDTRGRTLGFGARVLDDSLPKYLNSPQTALFDKSSCLYGINLAAPSIKKQSLVIIVEGYLDVITAHQNGFKNVVAPMGTAIAEGQVNALKRLTRGLNITLALDSDAAGEEAILRCVGYENTIGTEIKVVILPPGKDPDDIIKEDINMWQHLLEAALPIIDYTFDTVISKLDLTRARDKSLAVDKLLPIIAGMNDVVRQAHYLQKLTVLVKVSERNLESVLAELKSGKPTYRAGETKPKAVSRTSTTFFSSPREEYCLVLLLQHPELKDRTADILPEYFGNSENREIFIALKRSGDISSLRAELDNAIWERLDILMNRTYPANQIEQKLADCILNLKKEYLRSLAIKRKEALASGQESGFTMDELAEIQEPAREISDKLGEIFMQKSRRK